MPLAGGFFITSAHQASPRKREAAHKRCGRRGSLREGAGTEGRSLGAGPREGGAEERLETGPQSGGAQRGWAEAAAHAAIFRPGTSLLVQLLFPPPPEVSLGFGRGLLVLGPPGSRVARATLGVPVGANSPAPLRRVAWLRSRRTRPLGSAADSRGWRPREGRSPHSRRKQTPDVRSPGGRGNLLLCTRFKLLGSLVVWEMRCQSCLGAWRSPPMGWSGGRHLHGPWRAWEVAEIIVCVIIASSVVSA